MNRPFLPPRTDATPPLPRCAALSYALSYALQGQLCVRPAPPGGVATQAWGRLAPASALALALLAAGCASRVPLTPPPEAAATAPPAPALATPTPDAAGPAAAAAAAVSQARTPRDYRRDAARHLYERNAHRIFAGKLPPMLYAIGVLEVHVDPRGQVTQTHWLRAPKHAPEVVAEIERTVREAAPFPRPARLGRVVYTETWLWDSSGRFQLDTLTEGQL